MGTATRDADESERWRYSRAGIVAGVAMFALSYYGLQRLAFLMRIPPFDRPPIWLSGALLLGILLVARREHWFAYVVAFFITSIAAFWTDQVVGPVAAVIIAPFIAAATIVGAWAIRRSEDGGRCRYQPETTLTFGNDAYCRFFNKTRDELIGRKFLELLPRAAREPVLEQVRQLAQNPRAVTHEHEVVLPDGTIGWQQWVDFVAEVDDGRVAEFQAIGRDVTDRKRDVLEGEFDVVAVAGDGFALLGAAETLRPDVIVSDIEMSGIDGIAAATEILKRYSGARIVFVTVHNEPELVRRALASGAMAYVLKLKAGDELIPAVQSALRGEQYVSPLVRKHMESIP